MIIAIEGCDGSGKSTLAESLKTHIQMHEERSKSNRNVHIIHSGPPSADPLIEYEKSLAVYDPDGDHLILDRWHWGETVYGPLYRGGSKLTRAGFFHVDKYLDSRGAVMLLARQEASVIRERLAVRGEDFLKDKHIEGVIDGFDSAFEDSVMTEKHIVTDNDTKTILAAGVLGYLREEYARELAVFPTYVGPRYPEYLLLGERRKDPSWQSAFVPGNATSGKFLLDALSRGVLLRSGLANACEEDVLQLYGALNAPRVCVLGKDAEKAVIEAGVPFTRVPHPQYIRRFHNKKQREYGQVIARGLYGEEIENWPS